MSCVISKDVLRPCSEEFAYLIRMHLQATEFLAGWCWRRDLLCYKLRPKHHYMLHISLDTASFRMNPKMWHNFHEESFLGAIKYVAKQCHGRTMSTRVLQRYLIGMAGFLTDR